MTGMQSWSGQAGRWADPPRKRSARMSASRALDDAGQERFVASDKPIDRHGRSHAPAILSELRTDVRPPRAPSATIHRPPRAAPRTVGA
jgi:hypothetical protein